MIKYRPLSSLKPLEYNPRKITDIALQKLVESLQASPEYFEARPIILSDRTGELVILAGNKRYEAASILGLVEVPTFLIEGLTEEKEREIVIRDNVNNGEWDMGLLQLNFDEMELMDWGLNVHFDIASIPEPEEKEPEIDKSNFDESAESYLNGTIRQIVLYYDVETHKAILNRLQAVADAFGIDDDNSATVMQLLDFYEARI